MFPLGLYPHHLWWRAGVLSLLNVGYLCCFRWPEASFLVPLISAFGQVHTSRFFGERASPLLPLSLRSVENCSPRMPGDWLCLVAMSSRRSGLCTV